MAKKLPIIIDNRNDNTLLRAFQKLLPNLEKMDIATGIFEIGSFLIPEGFWQNLNNSSFAVSVIFRRRQVSNPSIPGIFTSRRVISGLICATRLRAALPLFAVITSKPASCRQFSRTSRLCGSPSTIRILFIICYFSFKPFNQFIHLIFFKKCPHFL